jgi:hypothetical protein
MLNNILDEMPIVRVMTENTELVGTDNEVQDPTQLSTPEVLPQIQIQNQLQREPQPELQRETRPETQNAEQIAQTTAHIQETRFEDLVDAEPLYMRTVAPEPVQPKVSPVVINDIIETTTATRYNVNKNPLDMFEDILAEIDQRTSVVSKQILDSANQAHFDISTRFDDVGSGGAK